MFRNRILASFSRVYVLLIYWDSFMALIHVLQIMALFMTEQKLNEFYVLLTVHPCVIL